MALWLASFEMEQLLKCDHYAMVTLYMYFNLFYFEAPMQVHARFGA